MLNTSSPMFNTATKKKRKLATWLVPLIVVINVIFGVAILVIFRESQSEPAVLIEKWFKFFGYELLAMAGIQIAGTVGEHFGRGE